MAGKQNTHGTGLVMGTVGVLVRGPSGAGKSLLALELLDAAETLRQDAKLVADDRVDLSVKKGALFMHAPEAIEGLIELRGRGIVARPSVATARLQLIVDLVDDLVRMVEEDELVTTLMGVEVARCPVPRRGVVDSGHQRLLVNEALRALSAGAVPAPQKST